MHPILFSFVSPFSGATVNVPTYGLFYLLAIAGGILYVARRSQLMKVEVDRELQQDGYLTVILLGVVGARIAYIVTSWQEVAQHPIQAIIGFNAGGVFYGGLIGGLVGTYLFVRKVPGWIYHEFMDEIAPAAPLGHILGRLGCFFDGCCYGSNTNGPLGLLFPGHTVPCHPTQAYEATGLLVIFLICHRTLNRPHRRGIVVLLYVTLYSILRFVVEMYRGDDRGPVFAMGLSVSQTISVGGLVLAALYAPFVLRRPKLPPMDPEAVRERTRALAKAE
jgi:phosphatidylglycerol:prolipoprotein diacylglycerol transferase